MCRRRCEPTVGSLSAVEAAALAGAPAGTRLEVVIEPTGPAWLPIAVFFAARGHLVFRVSSAKAADLRRFLSRHAKSNGIDADTLARLPLVDPAGLPELELPGAEAAALDRRVRATDRLTRRGRRAQGADQGPGPAADAVHPADRGPRAWPTWRCSNAGPTRGRCCGAGPARLTALIAKASNNHQGPSPRPAVARGRVGGGRALRRTPRRRLHRPGRRSRHRGAAAARGADRTRRPRRPNARTAYRWADPGQLARSLPGLAEVGAPALTAGIGRAARFPSGAHFKSYVGLAPRASQTGDTDRKGQPMSKAGSSRLRVHPRPRRRPRPQTRPATGEDLLHADGRTRRRPPQGAVRRRRPPRRTQPGPSCNAACPTSSATPTAPPRSARRKPSRSSPNTGPSRAEVRARRRSRKHAGKAPQQVLTGHDQSDARGADKRGDLPRPDPARVPHTGHRNQRSGADPAAGRAPPARACPCPRAGRRPRVKRPEPVGGRHAQHP